MKRCLNKKINMKTKILLLGAVVAAFSFSTFAADALLSPRAKENQIKVVSSSTEIPATTIAYVDSTSPALLSPRAQGNQIKVVKGVFNDRNPYLECRNTMTGSPKAVTECSSHTTMPGCQTVTVAPLK
jgi:hypothetical protein